MSVPAFAQDPATVGGVQPAVLKLLQRAAVRDGGAHLETVVLLAIDANPAKAPDILAAVADFAPDRIAAIRAAAETAYPDVALETPSTPAPAQVAKAAAHAQKPLKGKSSFLSGWSGEAELSGARSTGNSDLVTVGLAGNIASEIGNWRHKLTGLIDFQESAGETTKRRWMVNYEPNYAISDRAYLFGLLQYEDDRFGGFQYRITESIGMGYQVLNGETLVLHVEGGPGARHIDYAPGPMETEFTALFRSGLKWRISDGSSFTHDFAYFRGTDQESVDTTAALTMRINGSLSGRISYNYRYNSNVPITSENVDTITRAALLYEF